MRSRGFTLVEVLVSMVVVTIGLLAGAKLIGEGISQGATARRISAAHHLANQVIERLRIEVRFDAEAASGSGTVGGVAVTAENAWKADRLPYSSLDTVGGVAGITCNPEGAIDDPIIGYNVGPLPYRFEGGNYWLCYQIVAPNSATCLSDASCAFVKVLWRTEKGFSAHRTVAFLTSGR